VATLSEAIKPLATVDCDARPSPVWTATLSAISPVRAPVTSAPTTAPSNVSTLTLSASSRPSWKRAPKHIHSISAQAAAAIVTNGTMRDQDSAAAGRMASTVASAPSAPVAAQTHDGPQASPNASRQGGSYSSSLM